MNQQPHPDEITDWQALKAIKRGAMQAADTAAMNAMYEALEAGKSKQEAETIFNNTYKAVLNANQHNVLPHTR